MALSDDQRALLRLLAQREEGYEDIAALKGLSVEQVRAEVREALAALDAPAPDPSPAPPPPPAVEAPPARKEPEPEEPPAATPVKREKPPRPAPASPRPAPTAERRRLVLFAGGGLGIVAVVLLAIAVLGGDSDTPSPAGSATPVLSESAAAKNAKLTKAVLRPMDGGSGEGLALFGRARKEVILQIAAQGLEPAPKGKAYVVWLAGSPKQMVPVTPVAVSKAGEIAAQFPIPAEVLVYLAEGVFDEIDISLVSAARYKAAFAKARSEKKQPGYTGTDVLRGKITGPIVDAAAAASG